jgi:hypothetical protein
MELGGGARAVALRGSGALRRVRAACGPAAQLFWLEVDSAEPQVEALRAQPPLPAPPAAPLRPAPADDQPPWAARAPWFDACAFAAAAGAPLPREADLEARERLWRAGRARAAGGAEAGSKHAHVALYCSIPLRLPFILVVSILFTFFLPGGSGASGAAQRRVDHWAPRAPHSIQVDCAQLQHQRHAAPADAAPAARARRARGRAAAAGAAPRRPCARHHSRGARLTAPRRCIPRAPRLCVRRAPPAAAALTRRRRPLFL